MKKTTINGNTVWLTLDPLRVHNENTKKLEERPEKLCYFSFEKPNSFIYGELIRDSSGRPIFIQSFEDAEKILSIRLK